VAKNLDYLIFLSTRRL